MTACSSCDGQLYAKGLCRFHYRRQLDGVPLDAPRLETGLSLAERLLRRSEPDLNSGCLLWFGAVGPKGYGLTAIGGKTIRVHRAAWIAWRGPIPDDLHVLHTCDTPPCINADHLYLGLDLQNAADREARGRGAQPRGEANANARLTADAVLLIRALLAKGEAQWRIAERFGVSQPTIGRIHRGLTWRHVPENREAA